jgi:hypothetical protein
MPLLAAGIGAAGSIGSGLLGSKSSKSAAKAQASADQAAANGVLGATKDAQTGLQGAQASLANGFSLQNANLSPYLTAGTQGVNSLAAALAPGGSLTTQFGAPTAAQAAATPGEQFMLQQGSQAIDRSAAARGGINTGATLQAQQAYGQGLASTAYQQAYNNALNTFQTNHNNTLGGLLALTGVGQNATGQFNQATQNFEGNNLTDTIQQGIFGLQGAQSAGNFIANSGNANANGIANAGNSWSGALNGVVNSVNNPQTLGAIGGLFGSSVKPQFNPGSGPGYGYGPQTPGIAG